MSGKTDMKKKFNDTLLQLAREDRGVIIINSDSQKVAGTAGFAAEFPERSYNVGIAEANMASVAAGFATFGKMPVINSFTAFMTRRCFDQITISLAYAGLPAMLVGTNPGIASELNGGTHMSFEDVGIMRLLPGMTILEPADGIQLEQMMREAILSRKLVYFRLFRGMAPNLYGEDYRYVPGKGDIMREGKDVTLIGSGMTVAWCLEAADLLALEGIQAEVVNMHTIKPLDEELVTEEARKTRKIVTVENSSIMGGLGGAVAEVVSEKCPVPVKRIGVADRFGEVGDLEYLKHTFGLDAQSICESVREFVGNG